MTNNEFKKGLEERTKRFAVEAVKFCMSLRRFDVPYVLFNQLIKSATSIGANYRDANRAESKKDFIHKIAIIEKEASETVYWLEIYNESHILPESMNKQLGLLYKESDELLKIFSSISRTARNNSLQH